MTALHLAIYASLFVFIVGVVARVIRILKMPVHVRWELYPIPHEKGRAHYGGSIMEEVDWWTKEREIDKINELKVMIPEMLFLNGVREHNKPLWFSTFSLHFGLYILIGEFALMILAAILQTAGIAEGLINLIVTVMPVLTWIGCGLGTLGTILMLKKRLTDKKLKMYNCASHYFNLLLLGAIYVTGIAWIAGSETYASDAIQIIAASLSATAMPALGTAAAFHLGFVLFFVVYFPFTHMTHAFVKWFTYHDIRWEDSPNKPGSEMQKKIEKLEGQPVTWAANHIKGEGRKNWGDLVMESGEEKTK